MEHNRALLEKKGGKNPFMAEKRGQKPRKTLLGSGSGRERGWELFLAVFFFLLLQRPFAAALSPVKAAGLGSSPEEEEEEEEGVEKLEFETLLRVCLLFQPLQVPRARP